MTLRYSPGDALTVQQVRELDVLAIEHVGIPGVVLMENAGRRVAEFVFATLVDPARAAVVVLCGPGNNGGDGFVAARHLHNAGVSVCVVLATPRTQVSSDAAAARPSDGRPAASGAGDRRATDADINLGIVERMRLPIIDATTAAGLDAARAQLAAADVILDALLGTGARGDPREPLAALLLAANAAPKARRIAVDIPSGLDADTGAVGTPCFQADATVTLLAEKVGFAARAARAALGRVVVADIGVPRDLIPRANRGPRGLDS